MNSFDVDTQSGDSIGYNITDETDMEPVVEEYIRNWQGVYGQDDRIIIWNIWNELGNSDEMQCRCQWRVKLLAGLGSEDVKQPLTIEMWGAQTDGKIIMNGFIIQRFMEKLIGKI